jgi:hypothetical protein
MTKENGSFMKSGTNHCNPLAMDEPSKEELKLLIAAKE